MILNLVPDLKLPAKANKMGPLIAYTWPFIVQVLITVAKATFQHIVLSLLTQKMLEQTIIWALEKLSKRTKTKLDDNFVKKLKKALQPAQNVP